MLRSLFLAVGMLAWSGVASASLIILDFNIPGRDYFRYDPYFEDGFRVSSVVQPLLSQPGVFFQQHYDLECALGGSPTCGVLYDFLPEYDGTSWLGTDSTSCRLLDESENVVGFGSLCGKPRIRIDYAGGLFTPIDLLSMTGGVHLASSKGGALLLSTRGVVAFTGDVWSDIEWLELSVSQLEGAPMGFDDLRVRVPEPGPLLLLVTGLLSIALSRRGECIRARLPRSR